MTKQRDDDDSRVFNFSAGPSCLPVEILREAQEQLINYHGEGMSVMEMSHRSRAYANIHEECVMGLKELLNIPDNFNVLLLAGGATLQFASIPMNLIQDLGNCASYALTGTWSRKAYEEGLKYGKMEICADNKESNYTRIPSAEQWRLNKNSKYLHYCSNETVHGVEFHSPPDIESYLQGYENQHVSGRAMQKPLLVSDFSSNFCSGEIDFSEHALVYAGAQKNVGPAGVTIVILREDITGKELQICPTLCSYKTQIKNDSLYNTPPCFPIYMVNLMVKYIKQKGGISRMDELKTKKSEMIYSVVDSSDGFYYAPVEKSCRSKMNVRFYIPGDRKLCSDMKVHDELNSHDHKRQELLEKEFIDEAKKHKLYELRGHRSIGGCRASLYTGMTLSGVEALVDFMQAFQQEKTI